MFKLKLRSKIILPAAMILVLLVMAVSVYSHVQFRSYASFIYDNQIDINIKNLNTLMESNRRNTAIAARMASEDANVIAAVKSRDATAIIGALSGTLDAYQVSYYTVCDAEGIVLARTYEPDNFGDSVLSQQNIQDALAGTRATYLEAGSLIKVSIRSGSPVYDADGTLLGAISAGVRFDTNEMVDSFKESYNAEFTVFYGDERAATTIYENGARIVGTKINPDIGEIVINNKQPYSGDAQIVGQPYRTYYQPLINPKGEVFAILFIGNPQTDVVEKTAAITRDLILIGIAGLLISIAILWFITGRIIVPVKRLGILVSEISHGNLDIQTDNTPVADDEIGGLTRDIYAMADTIRAIMSDLSQITEEINGKGDIDYRMRAEQYQGAYRSMVSGINGIVDGFVGDILSALDALAQIGKGNFNFSMRRLTGKKAVINEQFDLLTAELNNIHSEITALANGAADGDLHRRADTGKYQGGWAQLLDELNALVDAVARPLDEISLSLSAMAQGNFDQRITGAYKGAFDTVKRAVGLTEETTLSYIQEISDILTALAGGDLTVTVHRAYAGAYAPIKAALNTILGSLNKSMREIEASADQVLVGAENVAQSAGSLSEGAIRQASAVEQLTAQLVLIGDKTMLSSQHAVSANELSQSSTQNALSGNESMKSMVASMSGIKESSANISKIIQVIDGIAFQTNLLALNAAVEAARAGEHGKGFAVVSDEVRNLAARSSKAAKETTGLIEDSIARVGEGMDTAHETEASLETIVGDVRQVSEIISQIAAMSHEQAQAIAQISDGLHDISSVVQSTSSTSEESAAAAQELSAQAETLKHLVSFFKMK